jgi:FtsH-binding integral membrane protein
MLGSVEKASVLGAIHLYINFVNIFLFLLRLMGSRR